MSKRGIHPDEKDEKCLVAEETCEEGHWPDMGAARGLGRPCSVDFSGITLSCPLGKLMFLNVRFFFFFPLKFCSGNQGSLN